MTPDSSRAVSLKAWPSLYSSPGSFQHMPFVALAVGGLVPVGQAEFLLGQSDQVRGEDDAAGVSGPVLHVQAGVALGQMGIAAIAEDALHEIQVADQVARREEADFHGLFRLPAGHPGQTTGRSSSETNMRAGSG